MHSIFSFKSHTKRQYFNKTLSFHWYRAGRLPLDDAANTLFGLAGPIVGIYNNYLLIGGGSNFPYGAPWDGGQKEYYDHIYVFAFCKDSFTYIHRKFRIPYKVAYGANCTSTQGLVLAGGENNSGSVNKVLLIFLDGMNQLCISALPDLPMPLTSGMAVSIKNKIYYAGGQNSKLVSNKFYLLDLDHLSKGWQSLHDLPHPVSNGLLLANNRYIYLIGGRSRNVDSVSKFYSEVYRYDLCANIWQKMSPLPYPLSAETGVTWNDSTLLVISGDKGNTFHRTERLLIKIAREMDVYKRAELIKEKNKLQSSHPGFDGVVLSYNIMDDRWEKIDSIPFPGQVTTTAVKWGDMIIIPCGEIRAGVRTPDIIVGKINN